MRILSMLEIPEPIIKTIIKGEIASQVFQQKYYKALPRAADISEYEEVLPTIYVPKKDGAELIIVFVEGGPVLGRVHFHLVFSDEYAPISAVDEMYRKIRKAWFGRTADIETVGIDLWHLGPSLPRPTPFLTSAEFLTTHSGLNPYEVSIHHSGREMYFKEIYVNTWNHLMSCSPSIWLFFGGYTKTKPEFAIGGREDAERFAQQLE